MKSIKNTEIDFEGFKVRNESAEILDCIAIAKEDSLEFVLYSRKSSNLSVTDTFVRSDEGVIDIDRARISISSKDFLLNMKKTAETDKEGRDSHIFGSGLKTEFNRSKPRIEGRFPTNFILQHEESCMHEGTQKVKSRSGFIKGNYLGAYRPSLIYEEGEVIQHSNPHINEDGTEEVLKWNCSDSCAVKNLDDQSGVRPSTLAHIGFEGSVSNPFTVVKSKRKKTYGKDIGGHGVLYGDSGGASRFYKQVQGKGQLDEYLNTLLRREQNDDIRTFTNCR